MNHLQKKAVKDFANKAYSQFENDEISLELAARKVELWILEADSNLVTLNALRNDISTHMGKITDTFDRNKHTHRFANL